MLYHFNSIITIVTSNPLQINNKRGQGDSLDNRHIDLTILHAPNYRKNPKNSTTIK